MWKTINLFKKLKDPFQQHIYGFSESACAILSMLHGAVSVLPVWVAWSVVQSAEKIYTL